MMIATLFALLAVAAPGVKRDARGRIERHRAPIHAFMRAHPCPGGTDKGSTKRCRGYVVDHRIPLCAGGADAPENMSWQSAADGHAKDQIEVALCKWIARESSP